MCSATPNRIEQRVVEWILLRVLVWFPWLTAPSSRPRVTVSPCHRHFADVVRSCARWAWHHHTWDVWHEVPSRLMSGPRCHPVSVFHVSPRPPWVGLSAQGLLKGSSFHGKKKNKTFQWEEFPSSDGLFSLEENADVLPLSSRLDRWTSSSSSASSVS